MGYKPTGKIYKEYESVSSGDGGAILAGCGCFVAIILFIIVFGFIQMAIVKFVFDILPTILLFLVPCVFIYLVIKFIKYLKS
ncbi:MULTISPECIES: hypothetical protein [unclassified Staphylococcus]|uniref:hypothetical protein n=1 Tax=unclassified Staphylococcus TaxID=91994 RepID=UPI0021D0B17D|nr:MULTISPECIES: hypothetical protein [unclassified Staphylococcus]UXR78471.1 hypothetical protein MUA92_00735 [Staphylococcus sp. IVB6227]UXR82629.1 hypothetical protein MUA51_00705 [Staphylococcus sp. IVB6214]